MSELPETPQSREEEWLALIAGMEGIEPGAPISRVEKWLAYIAENGGGGGGGDSSDAIKFTAQTLTEAQQMQARKNQGLYCEDVETIEWDGDTEGRTEIPINRFVSMYRTADTNFTESNIDTLAGAQVKIRYFDDFTEEWNYRTETVLYCDKLMDKVYEIIISGSFDYAMLMVITETMTADSYTFDKGIYFARIANEDYPDCPTYTSSFSYGEINKIEEKYLPDTVASEEYVNQQISAAIADVDELLGSGVIE